MADHHEQTSATLARSSVAARLNTLAVEPTFLTRVHEATWQAPDAEMRKLVRRARGDHAQFHVGTRHGLELVFRGQGEAARLVVPRVCQQVLLDEAHCSHVAAHFGARRMYALLAARVWWPNMRKSCQRVCRTCQVCQRSKDST